MRRQQALLLAFLLLLMYTGSAHAEEMGKEGYPISDAPVTLTVMGCSAAGQPDWNDMPLFAYMQQLTGIELEVKTFDQSVFEEKVHIALAVGDLPDIIIGGPLPDADINSFGSRGTLIPLNDLIDAYAPNIKDLFDSHEWLRESVSAGDGNIYSLFYLREIPRGLQYCYWINADWMDIIGYTRDDLPETLESFTEMLRAFRDADINHNCIADEIPLEVRYIEDLRALIINSYGELFNSDGFYADDEGRAVYQFTAPVFRSYLEYAAMLYEEGLLDGEVFTISNAQLSMNSRANLVGVMDSPLPTTIFYVKEDGQDIKRYPMLPALTAGNGEKAVKNMSDPVLKGLFSITSACEHPEAAIKWIDYFYSYDGAMAMWQGAENSGYAYLDDTRTLWKTLAPAGTEPDAFRRTQTPACGCEMPFAFHTGMLEGLTNVDELYSDSEARLYMDALVQPYPFVSFNTVESEELSLLRIDVNRYLEEMEAKFITCRVELTDVAWEEFVNTINSWGAARMTQIYQEALNRTNEG